MALIQNNYYGSRAANEMAERTVAAKPDGLVNMLGSNSGGLDISKMLKALGLDSKSGMEDASALGGGNRGSRRGKSRCGDKSQSMQLQAMNENGSGCGGSQRSNDSGAGSNSAKTNRMLLTLKMPEQANKDQASNGCSGTSAGQATGGCSTQINMTKADIIKKAFDLKGSEGKISKEDFKMLAKALNLTPAEAKNALKDWQSRSTDKSRDAELDKAFSECNNDSQSGGCGGAAQSPIGNAASSSKLDDAMDLAMADGKMSLKEFKAIAKQNNLTAEQMKKAFEAYQAKSKAADDDFDKSFKDLDKNGDGELDNKEAAVQSPLIPLFNQQQSNSIMNLLRSTTA